MSTDSKEYQFSFFKPATEHARTNTKIITAMVIVWALAVFGFQFLLRALEVPTPEKTLITYESVNGKVMDGTATVEDKKAFIGTVVAVLGKGLSLKQGDKEVLQETLNWAVYDVVPKNKRDQLLKKENVAELCKLLGYAPKSLETNLLKFYMKSESVKSLSDEKKNILPDIMKKYTVHNESAITSARFLGFPFHYWYTAEFLLILFVGLCWIYCFMIDKLHEEHSIDEEND